MPCKIMPTSVTQFDEDSWVNRFDIDERDRSLRGYGLDCRCHHCKCNHANIKAPHFRNQSRGCHYFRSVRFSNALEQKSSAFLWDRETQFQVRVALFLDLRWLGVEKQLRVRQTQPLLWSVVQITGELGCTFRRF